MSQPTSQTPPDFLAQVRQGELARKAHHEAEALRQQFSGFGCDLGAFAPKSDAELIAEADRRRAAWLAPEANLKRALLVAAMAGSHEADRLLAAADRGDAGWVERAHALLGALVGAAA